MEQRNTQTITRQPNYSQYQDFSRDNELVQQRLNTLLALNAETARQKAMFRTEKEKLESELMKNPLSLDQTFAYFGLILGIFSPLAMFLRIAINGRIEEWIFGIMLVINLITAVVGYFSGKLIAKMVRSVENSSWLLMLLTLPIFGLLWGIITGGAGGTVVFVFGAFFGAILGGLVGGIALPFFTIFHRLLNKGERIETKHFLPLAFGVTFVICGFILGL